MRKLVLALSAVTLAIPAAMPAPAMARTHRVHHVQRVAYPAAYQCRRPSGTTGLIVGAAAGVLAGRELDKHGDRTTGTVLGGALGALLGRHVERHVIGGCR